MAPTAHTATPQRPGPLPRRLVLAGSLVAFAGVACLLAALVPGVLVGFGKPASSGGLTPPLPLAVGLTVAGGMLVHAGRLIARAYGRRR